MIIKTGRMLSAKEISDINDSYEEKQQVQPLSLRNNKDELVTDGSTDEDKKDSRWYLPRLNINDPLMWPSLPLEQRRHFTDEIAMETCLGNCCGVPGLKAGCCRLDPDDLEHVLGKVDEEWITETVKWFRKKGIMIGRADLVIDFEEGLKVGPKFFNDHPVFKLKTSYPFLRFKIDGLRFSCVFLNNNSGKCTIYQNRPSMCRNYLCAFVTGNFLVKSKDPNHPNTWEKRR